jgi:membrane-bound metal-dependent hydrolase YbcI (DUF457 family)
MLAINHVSLSTATVLGLAVYYNHAFFLPLIIFVIFAALLPDIDHQNSEISQLVPVINRFFGHRQFTHSILGTLAFAFLSYMIFKPSVYATYGLLIAGFIGIYYLHKLLVARANQVNTLTHGFFSTKQLILFINLSTILLIVIACVGALTVWKSVARDEIFVLLLLGYISHIFGDWITKEGVPLFWPWKRFFGLRIFRTGGGFETFLGLLLVGANLYLLYVFSVQFHLDTRAYWEQYITLPF